MGPEGPKAASQACVSAGALTRIVIARLPLIVQGHLEDAIEHHVQIVGYAKSVSGKAFEKALHKNLVDFSTVSAAHDEKKCLLEKFVDSMEPIKVRHLIGFHIAWLFAPFVDTVF